MLKKELRQKYKAKRQMLSQLQIENWSLAIANALLPMPIWQKTYYHIYLPITERQEVNTEYILHLLSGKDKEIIVSKSNFETREMTHFLLTDNTKIKKNEYHIPEPVNGLEVAASKIDVVFIPLLAFDKQGHRAGYGKGFYDKFLAQCPKQTLKIGLSYFEPEEKINDTTSTDIKLDYCVTPTQVYQF